MRRRSRRRAKRKGRFFCCGRDKGGSRAEPSRDGKEAMEHKALFESSCPLPMQPTAAGRLTFSRGGTKGPTTKLPEWAAAKAMEKIRHSHDTRLLRLERRMTAAEQKWAGCEKTVVDMGNQLESKLVALGTLIEENSLLQRRLDHLENLLKNQNFWILRFPPGIRGEIPKVPVTFSDTSVDFSGQEWRNLEEGQKELYKAVMRSNYEMLVSLDDAVSKPKVLSQIEQREEEEEEEEEDLCTRDSEDLEGIELPVNPSYGDCPVAVIDAVSWGQEAVREDAKPFTDQEDCCDGPRLEPQVIHHDVGMQVKQEREDMLIKEEPLSPGSPDSDLFVPVSIKEEEEEEEEQQCTEGRHELVSFAGHTRLLQAAEEEADPLASLGNAILPNPMEDPVQGEPHAQGCLVQCGMCNEGFVRQETLVDHQYSRKQRKFQCAECNRSFAFQGQLSQHLLTHIPGTQFHCSECNLCFSSQKALILHVRVHAVDWPLYCSVCNRKFTDAAAFDHHQQSHGPGQVRRCLECNVYFTNPAALEEHKRIHSEDWPFRCAQCDRAFVHERLLMEHLQNHGRTRSRRCHICGSWLSYKGNVEHTGTQLYHCKKCNTACRVQGNPGSEVVSFEVTNKSGRPRS